MSEGPVEKALREAIAELTSTPIQPSSDVVEAVARDIEYAIQFDPIFGKEQMSNGDWVTTIGQIEAILRISKLAAKAALESQGYSRQPSVKGLVDETYLAIKKLYEDDHTDTFTLSRGQLGAVFHYIYKLEALAANGE